MAEMTEEQMRRYTSAVHGMQSGVAMEMNYRSQPTEPKHLRVGINSAMADHSALAELLMAKGVITEDEYLAAIVQGAERERDRYQNHLKAAYGLDVTLA
jgi:hypothetical protein